MLAAVASIASIGNTQFTAPTTSNFCGTDMTEIAEVHRPFSPNSTAQQDDAPPTSSTICTKFKQVPAQERKNGWLAVCCCWSVGWWVG